MVRPLLEDAVLAAVAMARKVRRFVHVVLAGKEDVDANVLLPKDTSEADVRDLMQHHLRCLVAVPRPLDLDREG